tara:strand:- start:502 stop:624 length:123 start_codon:yes stop_codon:yes gene_type:complete
MEQNTPLKGVSQDFGTSGQETIARVLKRLKEEYGYGKRDD